MPPKNMTEKAKRESLNIKDKQLQQLKTIFPEVVADGKVSWEKLKAILGELGDSSFEKFSFSWAGKSTAIQNVLTPSKATLRPDKKESIKFDESENIFIEGDNLEVLKLLQNAYFEKIKMIYIDPPYNTGNDFVYKDDFKNSLSSYFRQTQQVDSEGNQLTTNTEANGRFHSDWLNMLYPRLKLAWNLLKDDGVIFISIDNNEVHHLRMMMDEIFGAENFIDIIIWKKRYGGGAKEKYLVSVHEYILFYAKNKANLTPLFVPTSDESISRYYILKDEKFEHRGGYRTHPLEATKSMGHRKNLIYPIPAPDGSKILPKRQWLWSQERAMAALANNDLEFIKGKGGWTVHTKQYLKDEEGAVRSSKLFSIIENIYTQHGTNEIIDMFGNAQTFPFPKPVGLILQLLQIGTAVDSKDIVLDLFAGSASTAQAVLEINAKDGGNRSFIMIQFPEPTGNKKLPTIAEIGKERIRLSLKKMSGKKKLELELNTSVNLGFKVFKLAQSNYPENQFEYDPEMKEKENEKAYKAYLEKACQSDLFKKTNEIDWVYENIIKEGLSLNSKITEMTIGKNKTLVAQDEKSEILICLDSNIADATVKALSGAEYKGKVFICFDKAVNDSAKANLGLHLSLRTI